MVAAAASVASGDAEGVGEVLGWAATALVQAKPISNAQRTRVAFIIYDDINALRRNAEVTGQQSEVRKLKTES
jgi:hypothetical protein